MTSRETTLHLPRSGDRQMTWNLRSYEHALGWCRVSVAWRNPTADVEGRRLRHRPWDTPSRNWGAVAVRDTIELSGGAASRPVGCVGRCLVAVGPMTKSSVLSVSLRSSAGLAVVVRDWADVSVDELQAAAPWRTFRWRHGHKYFSGAYWSSTQRDVVMTSHGLSWRACCSPILSRLWLASWRALPAANRSESQTAQAYSG